MAKRAATKKVVATTSEETVSSNLPLNKWDDGWTKQLVGELRKNELEGTYPTNAGLRRLFHKYVGTIISTQVEVVQAPNPGNAGRAVVSVALSYIPIDNPNTQIFVSDAADCCSSNAKGVYGLFPTSTATTMAENRCMRKALNLNILSSDETQTPDDIGEAVRQHDEGTIISDIQRNMIINMSNRLNISLDKLLERHKFVQIEGITHSQAIILLQELASYQRGPEQSGSAIPKEILNENT